ncbi:MAG: peptidylprolyl isomerase [bacterium]
MTKTNRWVTTGLSFALIASLFAGCNLARRIPDDAIVVVGKKAITPAAVTRIIEDMDLNPDDPQLRAQVVNHWVDHQILLHEARRRGLYRDREISRRVEELREELIINKLYEDAIRVEQPSDEQVVAYWQDHTGEFTRVTDEVQLIIAYAPSRNTAWSVRTGLDQSRSDQELISNFRDIDFDTSGYISIERLPRQVTRAIDPLRSGQASLPFLLEGRWLVVKLLGRENAGKTRPLDEMMPIIRAQLYAEERARDQIAYIEGLRREARRHGIVRINAPAILEMEHPDQDSTITRESIPPRIQESPLDQSTVEDQNNREETIPEQTDTLPEASPPSITPGEEPADTFDAAGTIEEPSGAIPGADLSAPSDTTIADTTSTGVQP